MKTSRFFLPLFLAAFYYRFFLAFFLPVLIGSRRIHRKRPRARNRSLPAVMAKWRELAKQARITARLRCSQLLGLTRFLNANRYPLRLKTQC
jgi:hypothetical protein